MLNNTLSGTRTFPMSHQVNPQSWRRARIPVLRLMMCVFLSVAFSSGVSHAAPEEQYLLSEVPNTSGEKTNLIKWTNETVLVAVDGDRRSVRVEGQLKAGYQKLSLDGIPITISPDRFFELDLRFTGSRKVFLIKVEGAGGRSGMIKYTLTPTGVLAPTIPVSGVRRPAPGKKKKKSKRTRYSIGFGVTSLQYSQTVVTDDVAQTDELTELLLTVKGGMEYALVPNKYILGFGFFYNALVLSKSGEFPLQILGGNVKLGFLMSPPKASTQFRLSTGAYYNTSVSELGFKGMVGPQIMPELSFKMSKNTGVLTYLKYAPILVNGSFDFSNSKEIAAGLHYRYTLKSGTTVTGGVDYSTLGALAGTDSAQTKTITFGMGMSF
jgi:hypothetical protein